MHDATRALAEQTWTTDGRTPTAKVRDGAQVVELTGLLDLGKWPAGIRVIVRREKPHPGAGLTLFEQADGWRYQASPPTPRIGQLGVPGGPAPGPRPGRGPHPRREGHRTWPVPVPGVHSSTKSGSRSPRSPPTWSPGCNSSPCTATWPRPNPKLLRFRMLHVPARLARGGRRLTEQPDQPPRPGTSETRTGAPPGTPTRPPRRPDSKITNSRSTTISEIRHE